MKKTIFLSGKEWSVASGFNLYVDISFACNASCPFCIAPTVGRKDGAGFFAGAFFALDLTESIEGTVQIVGGEPTISRRLPRLLGEIGQHRYRWVVLNTNDSRLARKNIAQMKANGVTHVNLSRHHHDERLNQEIMRLRPELSNANFAAGLTRILDAGMDVRLNCNIIKGYIDSVPHMLDYIDWGAALGSAGISFSQTFPLGLFDHQVPIEAGYTEKAQVDLRELVLTMDAGGKFCPAPEEQMVGMSKWGSSNWGSGARRRFWYGPHETDVSLKTLSGYDETGLPKETTYSKDDDWELQDGILAFAVLHPDGRLTASWDRGERLLFDPTKLSDLVPTFGRERQNLVPLPMLA